MFSRPGASAIVLVDHEQPAREMQVALHRLCNGSMQRLLIPPQTISTLTWLSVFYVHREDEASLNSSSSSLIASAHGAARSLLQLSHDCTVIFACYC
jgi:hypothetical protein